jgi:hypothetical protein
MAYVITVASSSPVPELVALQGHHSTGTLSMKISLPAVGSNKGKQSASILLKPPEVCKTQVKIVLAAPTGPSVTSPKKRARHVVGHHKRKKRVRIRSQSPPRGTLDVPIWDPSAPLVDIGGSAEDGEGFDASAPGDPLDDTGGPYNAYDVDEDLEPTQIYNLDPQSVSILGHANPADMADFHSSFAKYVDTMAAHAVTIIQICETLFVAQGWNARYEAGTVRLFWKTSLTISYVFSGNLVSLAAHTYRT